MLVGVFFFCVTVDLTCAWFINKPKKKELAVIQISTSGLVNTLYTESVLNNFFFKITLLQGGTEAETEIYSKFQVCKLQFNKNK